MVCSIFFVCLVLKRFCLLQHLENICVFSMFYLFDVKYWIEFTFSHHYIEVCYHATLEQSHTNMKLFLMACLANKSNLAQGRFGKFDWVLDINVLYKNTISSGLILSLYNKISYVFYYVLFIVEGKHLWYVDCLMCFSLQVL